MAHTSHAKDKLLNRIRRIRGQLIAIEAGIETEAECTTVLHVMDPKKRPSGDQTAAAEEMIGLLRSCL